MMCVSERDMVRELMQLLRRTLFVQLCESSAERKPSLVERITDPALYGVIYTLSVLRRGTAYIK